MHINRLFGIVHILLNQKRITSTELASRFEVSKRTILRDLDILSSAEIPIYTTKGKGGGVSILESYKLNKLAITDDDQKKILNALQCVESLTDTESGGLLSKLSSLFGKVHTNRIEVDFSNWAAHDQNKYKFELLKQTIINKQVISFNYSNNLGETAFRKAYPFKLLFKSQAWYLQAYCQKKLDFRFFKLNRINELNPLPENFGELNIIAPKIESVANEKGAQLEVKVVIRFDENIAYRVYDEFPRQMITRNSDNSLLAIIKIVPDAWFYQYLLSFEAQAEVLEPDLVREMLRQKIEKIKSIYQV